MTAPQGLSRCNAGFMCCCAPGPILPHWWAYVLLRHRAYLAALLGLCAPATQLSCCAAGLMCSCATRPILLRCWAHVLLHHRACPSPLWSALLHHRTRALSGHRAEIRPCSAWVPEGAGEEVKEEEQEAEGGREKERGKGRERERQREIVKG